MKGPRIHGVVAIILTTLTSLSTAQRYNSTVVKNSNCPCDRAAHKYCYEYTRKDVEDKTCYTISQPSRSMRVWDPDMDHDSRVVCTVWTGPDCDGRHWGNFTFQDNTQCVEPTVTDTDGGDRVAWWYRSFKCHHPGW
ncbi:hypothetical protein BKA56DRAFT_129538 [Ilyonectria sp. MPI-CAGE-AT-0026]|nr:hypothetical protein BKA56DRAFT_129538 [Ilyonectria sp. MPI-CAGE-AT-0026]